MKLDPIDILGETSSGLVGRILLFLSAGWVGMLMGAVSASFRDWSDFLAPHETVAGWLDVGSFSATEVLLLVLWPILLVILSGGLSCFLVPVAGILLLLALIRFVQDEDQKVFWWLLLVLATSLMPAWEFSFPVSWLVLAILWGGFLSFSWWALRTWYPEWWDSVRSLFRKRDPAKALVAPRKVSAEVWGRPVEGWDGEEAPEPEAREATDPEEPHS